MKNTTIININQKYLLEKHNLVDFGFTKQLYDSYKTIIIESQCGSGKTSTLFNHLGNSTEKFISIVSKRTLADQHLEDAKKYIKHVSTLEYRKCNYDEEANFIVCINSLYKSFSYIKQHINNIVVFIDEITAFCYDVTHNDTIQNLNQAYTMLKYIINNCKKLIVCQSEIGSNVFELLRNRTGAKMQLINAHRPNQNKICHIYHNNHEIFNKIIDDIKNNKPFLVSCDEKLQANNIHTLILQSLEGSRFTKNDVLLCSSESVIDLKDVENKILVYTPSITFGCDFNFNYSSNAYTFIKGNSITSDLLFQQSMRTRNLNTLHIYVSKIRKYTRKYNSLEDCKQYINDNKEKFEQCFPCDVLDTNDEIITNNIETSFTRLFTINEYQKDKMKTNLIEDYKSRLESSGFNFVEHNEINNSFDQEIKKAAILSKELKMDELKTIIGLIGSTACHDPETIAKIEHITKIAEKLGCDVHELTEDKYNAYLTTAQKYKIYLKTIFFMKLQNEQKNLLYCQGVFSFSCKVAISDEYKLYLISSLFDKYKIDISDLNDDAAIHFEDYNLIHQLDTNHNIKASISTKRDLIKCLYIKMKDIIPILTVKKKGGKMIYMFDTETITADIHLYIKKYENTEGINTQYLKLVNIAEIARQSMFCKCPELD